MGSSSGGKEKGRKGRHRSDSMRSPEEGGIDLTGDGLDGCDINSHDSYDSAHELRQRHSSKRYRDHHSEVQQRRVREKDRDRDRDRHRERERERFKDRRGQETEVIAVSESDSDSSDCVEVPLESTSNSRSHTARHITPPSPPHLSKHPEYDHHRLRSAGFDYRESSVEGDRTEKRYERSRRHRDVREYDDDSGSERAKRKRSDLAAREYSYVEGSGLYPRVRTYSDEVERYRRDRFEIDLESERSKRKRDYYGKQKEHSERRSRSKGRVVQQKHSDYEEERLLKRNRDHYPRKRRSSGDDDGELRNQNREVLVVTEDEEQDDETKKYEKEHPHKHQSSKYNAHASTKETNAGEAETTKVTRELSPIQENGVGDCLSIEETNKLRAKLGLKPLEMNENQTSSSNASQNATNSSSIKVDGKELVAHKDEWGEFLHKPADNLSDKAQSEKIRQKLHQRKERRLIEKKLALIRTLGESDEEVDDPCKWIERNKRVVDEKKAAEERAKLLEEMDKELEESSQKKREYTNKHLKGLKVDHEIDSFGEGKTVILTLKDADVLDDEASDTLINVNMIDDERYKKNVSNKKKNPLHYGYDVYEEQYDMFGNPLNRNILEKYDEDIDGNKAKSNTFVIGENLEEEQQHQRKLLELKTKLSGRRLETLNDIQFTVARDTFTEAELLKFKKPKKKNKKLRQTLKADDLLPVGDENEHLGSRSRKNDNSSQDAQKKESTGTEKSQSFKIEEEDDEYEKLLAKARKLKQKQNIIKKPLPVDVEKIKCEIKMEADQSDMEEMPEEEVFAGHENCITLNATAEFCRTLGDIPTYGMSGNREADSSEIRDYDTEHMVDEAPSVSKRAPEPSSQGTWNSLDPDEIIQPADLDQIVDEEMEEVAILDEEPDVGAGVANALRLALSKGYLEKEEKNRPSNSKMAHLQAKNYSIEDKSTAEDDKFGRRDRFHSGPIMDFKDKDNFKPNIKLEYIDDNGRILNLKEAFRYLSHKFHGKGPGKNKIEKRLKKTEQDGLMKTMSSTDTPLGTLGMLQVKQKEAKAPYIVLTGMKQSAASTSSTSISKLK